MGVQMGTIKWIWTVQVVRWRCAISNELIVTLTSWKVRMFHVKGTKILWLNMRFYFSNHCKQTIFSRRMVLLHTIPAEFQHFRAKRIQATELGMVAHLLDHYAFQIWSLSILFVQSNEIKDIWYTRRVYWRAKIEIRTEEQQSIKKLGKMPGIIQYCDLISSRKW